MSNKPIKKTDRNKAWAIKAQEGDPIERFLRRERVLIITQDKESSRIYLEALRQKAADGAVEVRVASYNAGPLALVQSARGFAAQISAQIAKGHKNPRAVDGRVSFRKIWVVFDKDDFSDFDQAVKLAVSSQLEIGCSNECFELWYLLHHRDVKVDEVLGRDEIFAELKKIHNLSDDYRKLKGEDGRALHEGYADDFDGASDATGRALALQASNWQYDQGARCLLKRPCTCMDRLYAFLMSQIPTMHST